MQSHTSLYDQGHNGYGIPERRSRWSPGPHTDALTHTSSTDSAIDSITPEEMWGSTGTTSTQGTYTNSEGTSDGLLSPRLFDQQKPRVSSIERMSDYASHNLEDQMSRLRVTERWEEQPPSNSLGGPRPLFRSCSAPSGSRPSRVHRESGVRDDLMHLGHMSAREVMPEYSEFQWTGNSAGSARSAVRVSPLQDGCRGTAVAAQPNLTTRSLQQKAVQKQQRCYQSFWKPSTQRWDLHPQSAAEKERLSEHTARSVGPLDFEERQRIWLDQPIC